ncbi:MAG: hypothetical protein GQ538_04240, partial [Xanthomonadales bacterium]|nr:hypothetical protein [Xanthomonadales bacterium]
MPDFIDTEDFEFNFGKYRGYSYAYVLNHDPSYIEWLVDQGSFALDESDLTKLESVLND